MRSQKQQAGAIWHAMSLVDIVIVFSSHVIGKAITDYSPRAILIAGSPFTSGKAFVRAQVNQSARFPQWVLSLVDVERCMNRCDLCLRPFNLEVQSTQHALAGAGMIVLHENVPDPVFTIALSLEALEKKPSVVTNRIRLDQQQT